MKTKKELFPRITIGLDLGDRESAVFELSADGKAVGKTRIRTTPKAIEEFFGGRSMCRVVMEAGTHSPWVSRSVSRLGHETVVANPSELYGKRRRKKRNDPMDAEFLARQGRADVTLLHPIRHRSPQTQAHLELIRARDVAVRRRTQLVNHVRGAVKSFGARLRPCSAEAFPTRAKAEIPSELKTALEPLLELVELTTQQIRRYDRAVEAVIEEAPYGAAVRLQQIPGVGPITALAFMLLVEDPARFEKSREVGAYFGLVPRLDESGDDQPQLRITKAGDELGRRLLVSAARYILGPFGPECDLRRHGLAISARGGANARKRAAVAVARKLSVLLHRLWVSGSEYDPDRLAKRRAKP